MGGHGSGRRWGSKETTADYQQVDVRCWRRDGNLVAGHRFVCDDWKVEVAAGLDVYSRPSHVILLHLLRGGQHLVWLTWTRCNYGGTRAWFLCPTRGCGRRVAILYGEASLACRHCHQLAYPIEQESQRYRALRRARAIRMLLGGSLSLVDPFPARPRGMHRLRYRRLYAEAQRREGAFMGGMLAFLDSRQTFQKGNG
jgi:hypothetical protein